MSYAYFVIFRQGRQARASRFVIPAGRDWPSAFRYEGRMYLSSRIALCNGDHFFDASGELVGFSFLFGGDTEVGRGRLAKECVNVEITPIGWLKVILAEGRSHKHDGCQRIYPFVYADGHADHMVLVQECPQCWTALGFRLAVPPLPEAVYEETPTL